MDRRRQTQHDRHWSQTSVHTSSSLPVLTADNGHSAATSVWEGQEKGREETEGEDGGGVRGGGAGKGWWW